MNLKKLFLTGAAKIFSPVKNPILRRKTVAQALRGDGLKIAGDARRVWSRFKKFS